jgi:antagonist of KipI
MEGDFLSSIVEAERKLMDPQVCAYGKWGAASALRSSTYQKRLRVMLGPESNWFHSDALNQFFQTTFTVTPDSNRMGLRLKGYSLERTSDCQLLSSAVCFGTVQVPADGNPVILAADHQTIGGYPRVAQVIRADLPVLGQLAPGDSFQFENVSAFRAQKLLQERELMINRLRAALSLKENCKQL